MQPQNISQINTTSIFNWLKPQLDTSSFIAVQTILSPCCELVASSISFSPSGVGAYTVVVTFNYPVMFFNPPSFWLTSNGTVVAQNGVYNGAGVVTFPKVTLTATSQAFSVIALTATSTDGNIGYYQQTAALTATP